ncbi:MAG: DUF4346 domain-containing protein [Nanoarchaeota archaeon]
MESKGKWWDPEKERNMVKDAEEAEIIEAKYDRIRDWRMDPFGYFLIRINREKELLEAAFCKKANKVEKVVVGNSAMEVFNTIIRENLISSLQHAADLGAELQKAEIALKHGIRYVQDDPLDFSVKL